MARQVLPWVGAAIGGYFGGPQGAQVGFMIGSLVGNAVDPLILKGPKLGEAGLQTSAEGVFRPIVMGTGAIKGNIIDRGNRRVIKKRESQGKSTGPKTETERVYWTYAIRICEAPLDNGPINVLRVWQDERLVFDATPETQIPDESYEFWNAIRFYDGNEEQLPDPDLEAYRGVGEVPAYRGTVYAVFPNIDLTDTGERIPDYRWEMSTTVTQSTWDYTWQPEEPYDSPFQIGQALYSSYWDRFVTATGNGVQVMRNGETEFTRETGGVPTHVAEHPLSKTLFFVLSGAGVYMSLDGGNTLTIAQAGIGASPSAHLQYVPDDEGYLYTMGDVFPYKSSASGVVWTLGETHPIGSNPHYVKADGRAFIAASLDGLIYRSATGMSGWSLISDINPPAGDLQELHLEPWSEHIFALFSQGRVYRSTDYGETWTLFQNSGSGVDFRSAVSIPEIGVTYINGVGDTNNVVYTLDGGTTKTVITSEEANRWVAYAWAPELNTLLGIGANAFIRANFSNQEIPLFLKDIVTFLGRRANLPDTSFDVTQLTDLVTGIVFAEDYTSADAIRTLMPVYNFDGAEFDDGSGYRINYVKRGRPVVLTVTIDDLVDFPDKTIRQDAYERPRVLHMAFQSPIVGYAPAKASPSRFSSDIRVVGEVSTAVPVSFGDTDEAWRRADIMLKMAWTSVAGEEEFTLSDKFLKLVPTDCIGVFLRGQVRRMLITEQSVEGGILRLKMLADRQSNYTSNLTGVPLPEPTPPPPTIAGPTIHVNMDIPALSDNADILHSYQAASGQNDAWFGAQIDRSTDNGANFSSLIRFNDNSIMGELVDPVADASPYYTDTTNSVTVRLYMDEEIASLTQQQFLSEGGAFALSREDSSGRQWEIFQYRDAEQDSAGNWVLSHLARGRLNTETSAHAHGDIFVLLDTALPTTNITAHLNRVLTYRATSIGRSSDEGSIYAETYTGQSQTEWPVAHILTERAGDTINGRIVPRHRFGTEDNPVRSINWSGYSVRIQDASDQIDQFDTISNTFSYDASGMDFPVEVRVSQINRFTGEGPSKSVVVE